MVITKWLSELTRAIQDPSPQLSRHMRRVLVPGFEPLHGEGFVRFSAVGPVSRVGMPPEALSVLLWLTPEVAAQAMDELGVQLAAALTLVCDRRVEVLNEFAVS